MGEEITCRCYNITQYSPCDVLAYHTDFFFPMRGDEIERWQACTLIKGLQKRGDYRMRPYLSIIQHTSLEIVCRSDDTVFD